MTVNNPSLILLDLQNEYQKFEEMFDTQLFCRFTDRARCLEHLTSRQGNIRSLHVFIPKSEHTIIDDNLLFSNTTYSIYWLNGQSINEMTRQYNFPMFVKVFDVQSLSMNLHAAATLHWIDQANRTQHEPDEHDMALQAGADLSNALAEELRQHMIFKTGVSPDHG